MGLITFLKNKLSKRRLSKKISRKHTKYTVTRGDYTKNYERNVYYNHNDLADRLPVQNTFEGNIASNVDKKVDGAKKTIKRDNSITVTHKR